jgi:hypothetical protein
MQSIPFMKFGERSSEVVKQRVPVISLSVFEIAAGASATRPRAFLRV